MVETHARDAADRTAATAPGPQLPLRARRSRLSTAMRPKEPISRPLALALTSGCFLLVLALWSIVSYGELVDDLFLPTPSATADRLYQLFANEGFAGDVWSSTRRILIAFALSAVVAVPLGIAIGSFRAVQAFIEPLVAAVRFMPATAFIPLFIIWFGIDETEKVAVICMGVFFPLTLLVADVSANVQKNLLSIAYTLGASNRQVFTRVLLPACWPGVIDNLRIAMGWAWTYLIVAELVSAETGIGHSILNAGRYMDSETVIAGILTIGALGLVSDALFRLLHRRLFPYAKGRR
ncbi:ABC transporter permease [Conexibacter arvalis]|uniref:NitT/TauT family transport system permease protein n=1 Tax=Conexibacter arvalis TaxID=912552 RepID=A0A840IB80_9ACTN|nr:ABC transporter permease [Conexibacter arvalis]MBB4662177.1 NitT/TauT family transport system permease protein [Conexibacter arvalis]